MDHPTAQGEHRKNVGLSIIKGIGHRNSKEIILQMECRAAKDLSLQA